MEQIICTKCGLINDYRVERKANNDVAYCNGCYAYIKNIPRSEPTFYVGKYKDKKITEIEDMGYLKWALKEMKLSAHMRIAISNRISQFEHIAR